MSQKTLRTAERIELNSLRNGDEITSATMHHSFRPPLSDLKSQKHQNSLLFLQLLWFEIKQIWPKSTRLLGELISSPFLSLLSKSKNLNSWADLDLWSWFHTRRDNFSRQAAISPASSIFNTLFKASFASVNFTLLIRSFMIGIEAGFMLSWSVSMARKR